MTDRKAESVAEVYTVTGGCIRCPFRKENYCDHGSELANVDRHLFTKDPVPDWCPLRTSSTLVQLETPTHD